MKKVDQMEQLEFPMLDEDTLDSDPVECFGQTFENDQARQEHFLELLRKKLKDIEFREIEGFPTWN